MSLSPAIVTTTVPDEKTAVTLAKLLIESKHAACINILGPVKSVYFWEQKITEDTEYKMLIKTFQSKWDEVRQLIRQNHPYSVPEISLIRSIDVDDLYKDYLMNTITLS